MASYPILVDGNDVIELSDELRADDRISKEAQGLILSIFNRRSRNCEVVVPQGAPEAI